MADNFDFDGSIFGNTDDTQNDGYSVPETADTDAFGAEDSYGDFYAPETADQQSGSFEDFGDDSYAPRNDSQDMQDNVEYDDYEERGIKGFINSFGGKSKILLIVTIALLLVFLIVLIVSGSKAKKNKNTEDEDVSDPPVIELSSDLPVNVPSEGQTYLHSDNTGIYTVDTGADNPGLNLRVAASTSSEAITRIMNGEQVEVKFVDNFSDEGKSWGYIVYEGQAGWVSMDYLVRGSAGSTAASDSIG